MDIVRIPLGLFMENRENTRIPTINDIAPNPLLNPKLSLVGVWFFIETGSFCGCSGESMRRLIPRQDAGANLPLRLVGGGGAG